MTGAVARRRCSSEAPSRTATAEAATTTKTAEASPTTTETSTAKATAPATATPAWSPVNRGAASTTSTPAAATGARQHRQNKEHQDKQDRNYPAWNAALTALGGLEWIGRGKGGVGDTEALGHGACDGLGAGDERGPVFALPKLRDHEIQNPAGCGIGDDALHSAPRGEIEPALLSFTFRHDEEYQARVAPLVADLGLGTYSPCPTDGQGKIGG